MRGKLEILLGSALPCTVLGQKEEFRGTEGTKNEVWPRLINKMSRKWAKLLGFALLCAFSGEKRRIWGLSPPIIHEHHSVVDGGAGGDPRFLEELDPLRRRCQQERAKKEQKRVKLIKIHNLFSAPTPRGSRRVCLFFLGVVLQGFGAPQPLFFIGF